jgi:phosphoglycolate phosphatase-like HAD superfamily hydrolase
VKLLLFDVDGTLLIGHGAGARAMMTAGRAVLGSAFSLDGVLISGGLDPIIYREAAIQMGISDPEPLHEAFRARYLQELPGELHTARVLPGVVSLLSMLAERDDVTLGLVTGNYRHAVPIKLSSVGLLAETFVLGAYGDDAPARAELVALAMQQAARHTGALVHPDDVLIIGDTPRDVRCAHDNGCRALAVATGKYEAHELQAAGADCVVESLAVPDPLLRLL